MLSPSGMKGLVAALVIACAGFPVLPALSQDAQDVRLQGTVEKLDGQSLAMERKDGTLSMVSLDSRTAVFTNRPASLGEVKPGDFVASAAVKGADGKLHSKELRIFPEALRGVGEGQRPMSEPGTLMTNASVSEVVAAPEGGVVKVRYKDGTAELIVDPNVPVTAVVQADPGALKPGMRIFVLAAKNGDGTLAARRILVTK
ncbi:MAG: hypothetical protein AB7S92_13380 [Parvibaculaceae bacterium]